MKSYFEHNAGELERDIVEFDQTNFLLFESMKVVMREFNTQEELEDFWQNLWRERNK